MICECGHKEEFHRRYTTDQFPIQLPDAYTICGECKYNKTNSLHVLKLDNLKYLEMKATGEL